MLMPRQLPSAFFIAKGGTSRVATMSSRSGRGGSAAMAGCAWPRLQASASIAQTTTARGQFTFIASSPRLEQASAAAFGQCHGTEDSTAACEWRGYLEGGEIARHRNWHGPAHLKGASNEPARGVAITSGPQLTTVLLRRA